MKIPPILKRLLTPSPESPDVPDDMTTDKVLRSLRRQRRVQMEEVEKKQLRTEILAYNRARDARTLVGEEPGVLRVPNTFRITKPQKATSRGFLGRGGLL